MLRKRARHRIYLLSSKAVLCGFTINGGENPGGGGGFEGKNSIQKECWRKKLTKIQHCMQMFYGRSRQPVLQGGPACRVSLPWWWSGGAERKSSKGPPDGQHRCAERSRHTILHCRFCRSTLPAEISLPASVALPFGTFERTLAEKANSAVAAEVKALVSKLDKASVGGGVGVPNELAALRKVVTELKAPEALVTEVGFSGPPPPLPKFPILEILADKLCFVNSCKQAPPIVAHSFKDFTVASEP